MSVALWPILAVWMGIALLVGLGLIAMIAWCAAHLARDMIIGDDGRIWCPVHQRGMEVHGVPRGFKGVGAQFVALSQCEHYGPGAIRCSKSCLRGKLAAAA